MASTPLIGSDEAKRINMAVWNQWCKTPPSMTHEVKETGHKFTSISAYYQFEKATEIFGPCGIGWGWDPPTFEILFPETPAFSMLMMSVNVWAKLEGERLSIPLVNSQRMFFKDGTKLDDDVFKKLLTDTVTKGLSYLGCAADVFQGFYDDNRYVEAAKRIEAERRAAEQRAANKAAPAAAPAAAGDTKPEEVGKHIPQTLAEKKSVYDAMCGAAAYMGFTASDIRGILKDAGAETLAAIPGETLVAIADRILKTADALQKLNAVSLAKENGNEEASRERVAVWLNNNGIDLLNVDPERILKVCR